MFAQLGRRYLSVSFIILSFMVLLTAAVEAADPRAGTVNWPIGVAQMTVKLIPAMPHAKYSVAVTPFVPKLGGYSPTSACTYFGIIMKDPAFFTVQHKRCDSGVAVRLDEAIQLDWILAEWTQ